MSKKDKYAKWYRSGFWSKQMLINVVRKGALTQEDYEDIVGEPFPEEEPEE
ncbi:MAG: XkdX family protein [Oscillospiraceae bacterium]|nr:XkdX family protein [Lachnospiraceae bacterium]MBQ9250841.1 XkdX family protein [Oscillospiraceae bacterium]